MADDPFGLAPVDIDPMTGVPLTPSDYAQGKFQRIATAVGGGLKNWVETPGRAYKEGITPEEAADWGAGTAFGMLGVGAPAGMFAKPGQVGVFGGKLAKTADLEKLAQAESMTAKGAFPDDIWTQTGWFKGADDKWRFEIPDYTAHLKGYKDKTGVPLRDTFYHPDLYAAYPDLAEMPTTVGSISPEPGLRGAYMPKQTIQGVDIPANLQVYGEPKAYPDPRRSTLLHEVQHAIQETEGFGRGSNPIAKEVYRPAREAVEARRLDSQREFERLSDARDRWLDDYAAQNDLSLNVGSHYQRANKAYNEAHADTEKLRNQLFEDYTKQGLTQKDRYDAYRRFAGEVEARTVQARADKSPEALRDVPPVFSEDVARGDQIIHFGSPTPMESRTIDPLYHGSPRTNLEFLNPSERGPLGPGLYTTPAEGVAKRYAGDTGRTYQMPEVERDIYRGAGHRTDAEWSGFKDDKRRLLEAAEPEKRAELSSILDGMWSGDGYPAYARIRNLYGGHEGAQNLFRKAGFEGISGLVDGPETVLFGDRSHPILRAGTDDPKRAAAGQVAQASRAQRLKELDAAVDSESFADFGSRRSMVNQQHAAMDEIAAEMGAQPGGAVFAREGYKGRKMGASISPEPGGGGKWRISRFDDDGFSGHSVFNSKAEAISNALREGYRDTNPNALRDLMKSERFERGNLLSEEVQKDNARRAAAAREPGSIAPGSFGTVDELMDHWSGRGVRNHVADRPDRGQMQLSDLVVPKDRRGQGVGTEFMRDLTKFADENGRMITLTAARDYGSKSLPRLKAFYKRFGFVENKGRNKDFSISDNMYRPKDAKLRSGTDDAASAAAGQVAQATRDAPGSIAPIRAYHGSPHDFDRFDLSKIGTGEGAQAYGRGLYFAENERVARDYRNRLAKLELEHQPRFVDREGRWLEFYRPGTGQARQAIIERLKTVVPAGENATKEQIAQAIADERQHLSGVKGQMREISEKGLTAFERELGRGGGGFIHPKPPGRMYEVGINAKPEQFLDWDRPLGEMPGGVRDILRPIVDERIATMRDARKRMLERGGYSSLRPLSEKDRARLSAPLPEADAVAGSDVYKWSGLPAMDANEGFVRATERLSDKGVPGIRYLDQGSRDPVKMKELADDLAQYRVAAKHWAEVGDEKKLKIAQGQVDALEKRLARTSNYVMFDDSLIDILRKYALPGAVGGGAAFGSLAPGDGS